MERRSRLCKVLDATSQLGNMLFLRRHQDSNSDESISGRSFWEARHGKHAGHWTWVWAERMIDTLLWFDRKDGMGHCELADLRDYYRAKAKVKRYEARRESAPVSDG